jgi:Double zinc ribbon
VPRSVRGREGMGAVSNELWFSQNHRDLSQYYGDDAGFDFEFYCERCGDTWRSGYEPYTLGRASGWLRRASNMAGGIASNVGWDVANTAEGLANTGWHKARDAAFQRAITKAAGHFNRCARCHNHTCDQCFNVDRGLCLNCAPNLQAEVEEARAQGQVAAARQQAYAAGGELVQEYDVTTERRLVCAQCGAENHGAKFCAECGARQEAPGTCRSCQSAVPATAKFCPECGTPA